MEKMMDNYVINNNNYYGETPKKNVCGILSFIFAMVVLLLTLLACCGAGIMVIPYIGPIIAMFFEAGLLLIFPLNLAGLILGIVGVNQKNRPRGLATAGLIINIILLLLGVVMVILTILASIGIIGIGIFATFAEMFDQYNIGY